MKIIQLQAQNIKNLKAIDITPPDEGAVMLRGENGAGKSAVIESLLMPLTGKKIAEPIRRGQRKGEIKIDMGEYVVRQTLSTTGAPRLEVFPPGGKGKPLSSPRALLDKIIGQLSFDPLAFATAKPAEQRKVLMKLAGLDFEGLDKERTEIFDQRTLVNRQVRDTKGELENMEAPDEDIPKEEVSVPGLVKLLDALREKRAAHEQWERNLAGREDDVVFWGEKIKELQEQLEELQQNLSNSIEKKSAAIKAKAAVSKQEPINPTDEDIDKAKDGMILADEINVKVRAAHAYREATKKLDSLESLAKDMTTALEKINTAKHDQIVNAKYPLEGLTVDDEQVLYNDIPLSQLSSGEQIRVSTAVAMALNPKLRVICVREGSLLDEKGIRAIQALAADKDYQLWIEIVGKGEAGILIEAGEVLETKE